MVGGKNTRSANTEENSNSISDAAMEKLISKVCCNFVTQLEAKIDSKFDKLVDKLSEVTNSIKVLDERVTSHSLQAVKLNERNDYIEQLLKKNSLRFLGIAELDNEDVVDTVISFIINILKVNCNISDIDSAFRLPKPHGSSNNPRSIMVTFVQNIKRNEVFSAKKVLKNTPYSIYEDLTASRYEILVAAKAKFGKNKAWSAGGNVFVWCDKDRKKILIKSKNDLL